MFGWKEKLVEEGQQLLTFLLFLIEEKLKLPTFDPKKLLLIKMALMLSATFILQVFTSNACGFCYDVDSNLGSIPK